MVFIKENIILIRLLLLAPIFACFLGRSDFDGRHQEKNITVVGISSSSIQSKYLIGDDGIEYPLLYRNSDLTRFMVGFKKGDSRIVNAILNERGGVIQLSYNGDQIYSESDYREARDRSLSLYNKGLIILMPIFLATFLIRRS